MLTKYLQEAMRRARYEIIGGGKLFYGEVRGFRGVFATASSLEGCREQLEEVLEEWVLIRVSRRLSLPKAGGVSLKVKRVA